ncbi:hypothetical protein CN680_17230 [Bacillus pseudomycoides]|uniref:hypothetical protein n=1 Tax=Bacillus pseudomycoides TaxID=64104 RepID=UPI000BEDDE1E|nr:hypothetical protein [Bacillus pseudomycoides]PDY45139.1 hypothetical protein CON79_21810 [Bacillus pseudomycoides]PED70414.1 hypothetical protein CON97_19665 [Bacillus pseudomycoides]PEI40045.1 hypothetical protein CN620_17170 [Bacillus pseudomycoides]PEJ75954.1 hypothetical protein CN680_17230 [Bacillus pseudomycoides]PEM10575.1 hypothetical protein CN628_22455 [Bacillus pseudomycoides]
MKSFGMLVISTVFSALLLYYNVDSFYKKFTSGNTYYWVNGILAATFLISLIINMKDIIKKNYTTSESN